jgi:glutaredoxin-like protein NrdH
MVKILMYGLTTCPHCKRTRDFLESVGADFEIIWLDKLGEDEKKKAIEEVRKISGSYSVPLVVMGDKWVLGYSKDKLQELLEKG